MAEAVVLPDVHKGDWLACRTALGTWVPKFAAKDGIGRAVVPRTVEAWPVVSVTDPKTQYTYNWPAVDVIVLKSDASSTKDAT